MMVEWSQCHQDKMVGQINLISFLQEQNPMKLTDSARLDLKCYNYASHMYTTSNSSTYYIMYISRQIQFSLFTLKDCLLFYLPLYVSTL